MSSTPGRTHRAGHLAGALEWRIGWGLRDITLDGNTFKSSHSVDKTPFVFEAGYGFVARYFRTREFEGQRERPIYGSFTISRSL